jgi:poly(A) polymerase
MGETCPRVMIMNRIGNALCSIISQQTRLNKIPGRRPESFIAHRDFNDIIDYSRITRGSNIDVAKQLDWWMSQAEKLGPMPVPPLSNCTEHGDALQRKKRRRRRRKSPGKRNATAQAAHV